MGIWEIVLSLVFFTLLGTVYVLGYNFFKKRHPEYFIHFYLTLTVVRLLLVGSVILIYTLAVDSKPQAMHFAIMFLIMYVVMMVVTLTLKH
jgi:hypothetical protein